jgi:hypothetical protein
MLASAFFFPVFSFCECQRASPLRECLADMTFGTLMTKGNLVTTSKIKYKLFGAFLCNAVPRNIS